MNLSFTEEFFLGDWEHNPDCFRVSDVTISNCNFYSDSSFALNIGAYYGLSLGDITITNSTFEASYEKKTGIYMKHATGNFNFEDNIFKNCGYNAIQLTEDNTHGDKYNAIDAVTTNDPMPKLTMVIKGNTFENIYSRPLRLGGCYEAESTVLVENNVFTSPSISSGDTQFVKFATAQHDDSDKEPKHTYNNGNNVTVSIGTNTYYDQDNNLLSDLTVANPEHKKYFEGCIDKV